MSDNKNKNMINAEEALEILQKMQEKIDSLERELNDTKIQSNIERHSNNFSSLSDEVTIVFNMLGSTLRAEFPTWKLSLTTFGQKYTITKGQFQELLNNKRAYFRKEYIVLDAKHLDLAMENGIKVVDTTSNQSIQLKDIEKFGQMNSQEMTDYYNKLSEPMKNSFVNYIFNRCCEKDPKFFNVSTMNTINMLIGGRLFDNLISVCASQQQKKTNK